MDSEGVEESVHINRVSLFREIVIRVSFHRGKMNCL